jgi:hypothetical protein
MKLETIGGITMSDHCFKVGWQVYNVNGIKGAFLRTDTAADAQPFRNKGYLRFGSDFDAELAGPDDRARFLAFLATFLANINNRERVALGNGDTFGLH